MGRNITQGTREARISTQCEAKAATFPPMFPEVIRLAS